MGKKLSMARSEGTRQPLLLASGRTGVFINTSAGRNKRAEAAPAARKAKGGKAKGTSAKGKASPKAKDPHGSSARRGRPRMFDKDRKSNRGTEGEDGRLRRSACELGVEWIGSYCPDGQPHFLIGSCPQNGWSMFRCKYCLKHTLLPTQTAEAIDLTHSINKYGGTKGYCKFMDKHWSARMLIAKLQYLWRTSQGFEDKVQLIRLAVRVMEDKEFDRKDIVKNNFTNE